MGEKRQDRNFLNSEQEHFENLVNTSLQQEILPVAPDQDVSEGKFNFRVVNCIEFFEANSNRHSAGSIHKARKFRNEKPSKIHSIYTSMDIILDSIYKIYKNLGLLNYKLKFLYYWAGGFRTRI